MNYERVVQQFVLLSMRFDFEMKPSVLRACLMLSAMQFMNLATAIFLWDSFAGRSLMLSRSTFVLTIASLILLNLFLANWRPSLDSGATRMEAERLSPMLWLYLATTILGFCVAVVLHTKAR